MQSAGGWPGKVKRRDGRLVTFDVTRIESAVARAAREVGHAEPQLPASLGGRCGG
jgi:ribonucleoside-diphosphate reductase alpha chain